MSRMQITIKCALKWRAKQSEKNKTGAVSSLARLLHHFATPPCIPHFFLPELRVTVPHVFDIKGTWSSACATKGGMLQFSLTGFPQSCSFTLPFSLTFLSHEASLLNLRLLDCKRGGNSTTCSLSLYCSDASLWNDSYTGHDYSDGNVDYVYDDI